MANDIRETVESKAEQDRLKRIFDSALDDARKLSLDQILSFTKQQREKVKRLLADMAAERMVLRAYSMTLESKATEQEKGLES